MELQERYPGRVSVTIGFDESLAHLIEAGSDAYLMPSKFEPCGLNQMYSLKYGTLPIVNRVGGLADSVRNASKANLEAGTATGFVMSSYDEKSLCEQIDRAITLYNDRAIWYRLIQTAMTRPFSWKKSAAPSVTGQSLRRTAVRARTGRTMTAAPLRIEGLT